MDDPVQAAQLFRAGLSGHVAVGDRAFIEMGLRHAALLMAESRPVGAARLLGASERIREALGVRDNFVMITVRPELSDDDLEAALAAGRTLTVEQATAEALAGMDSTASGS